MPGQAPRSAIAACCLAAAAVLAAGDGEWMLRHADPATRTTVHTRDRGDAPPEFRAVTRLNARLSTLVAVLRDSERMPQWVYRTRSATPIEATSPTAGVSLVVTAMPWPLKDRDAVVAWTLAQDPASGEVVMQGRSAPDRAPPDPQRVRMPAFESRWRFVPLVSGEVEVVFEGQASLGGNLELPILREFVRSAVWQAPLATITGLRRMVQQPRYRDAAFDFIREPAPR